MSETTINDATTMGGAEPTLLAGRYRVVRQLGQGGMGSVWLAEDEVLDNHPVAIKMLPAILVANRRAYQQVKAEALVSLKLSHPNIVTMRAFEENGGNPFLVMDYIEGRTLDDYLAEKGALSEAETVRLLAPVAAALDFAHSQGVVHRDVKPGNVMVRSDGTPFVLDFGIAREMQETMTRMTGKLSSGTLMYMSPEQLNGEKPAVAQDVYSFAAMVYECLKGEPPFCRGQIEHQIEHNRPEPLGGRIAIAPSVMAGLEKMPQARPATCAAVLAAEAVGMVPKNVAAKSVAVVKQSAALVAALQARVKPLLRALKRKTAVWLSLVALGIVVGGLLLMKCPKAGDTKTITLPGGAEMKFVWCPPGSFMMGSPTNEDGHDDDETQHRVTLTKGFWLGQYEVTQRQWKSVMGDNPSGFKGDDRPVDSVSWEACQKFIAKCNTAAKGVRFALPTEAQWEYACRAGSTGTYAGTDTLDTMGWYDGNSGGKTHPVGQKQPNAWNLYDMHGNVWEWCSDRYGSYEGDCTDPTGPASGSYRVLRGGSWNSGARYCRSAYRGYGSPSSNNSDIGFRLCCSAGPHDE